MEMKKRGGKVTILGVLCQLLEFQVPGSRFQVPSFKIKVSRSKAKANNHRGHAGTQRFIWLII